MAEETTTPPENPPLPPEEANADSEASKMDDERYVGVDPIYKNSAYEEPLEVEPEGRSKDAKAAVQDELDMLARAKENEAGCRVEMGEPQSFEEWAETAPFANRKNTVRGVDSEQKAVDDEATADAKNDEGRIPPHSTSLHQPGVHTVS